MIKGFIERIRTNQRIKTLFDVLLIFALSLYIFSLPSFSGREKFNLISYALMGVSIVLVFIKYVVYDRFTFDKRLLILLAFTLEAFIGTAFYSHDFIHWLTIVLLFSTLVVFYYAFRSIGNQKIIFKMIAYSLLAFGVYFAIHYRNKIIGFDLEEPIEIFFDNPNTLGTYFSIGSVLFLYLAMNHKRKIEWLYLLPSLALLFLGIFTGSRHFIITTGVAISSTILISFRRKKWLAAIIIVAVIASFFLVIQLPFLAPFKERIDRAITTLFGIGNAKYDPSAVQRTIWPQYGFSIGSKVLFFGFGAEGFSKYSGIGTYSHNTYSEIFCNFGIVGLILFYVAFLHLLVLAFKSKNRSVKFVIVIVLFYFTKSFFGVCFNSKDTYVMFALSYYLTKDTAIGDYLGFFAKREHISRTFFEVQI